LTLGLGIWERCVCVCSGIMRGINFEEVKVTGI
jgi:hypothetical protein